MKKITFTVPCYNSQDYMKRCIDSLLVCKEEGEIIIVDEALPTEPERLPTSMQRNIRIL